MEVGKVNIEKSVATGLIIILLLTTMGSAGNLISTRITTAPVIDGAPEEYGTRRPE